MVAQEDTTLELTRPQENTTNASAPGAMLSEGCLETCRRAPVHPGLKEKSIYNHVGKEER